MTRIFSKICNFVKGDTIEKIALNVFGDCPREARARCWGWGRKSESATRHGTTRPPKKLGVNLTRGSEKAFFKIDNFRRKRTFLRRFWNRLFAATVRKSLPQNRLFPAKKHASEAVLKPAFCSNGAKKPSSKPTISGEKACVWSSFETGFLQQRCKKAFLKTDHFRREKACFWGAFETGFLQQRCEKAFLKINHFRRKRTSLKRFSNRYFTEREQKRFARAQWRVPLGL